MAVTTDAFTMNWKEFRGYANPNKESTGTGTPITSRACTCGSSMESTRVVPHVIEHANTHTAPNPPEVEPNPNHIPRDPTGSNPNSSILQSLQDFRGSYKTPHGAEFLEGI